jgi:hypothetical protein
MFESVVPDPGNDALTRLARIFLVLTVLGVLALVVRVFGFVAHRNAAEAVMLAVAAISPALSYVTSRGVEAQRSWAKILAYVQGFLFLFNFPIGTVIGIAVLIYVSRAAKAGLFTSSKLT